MRRLGNESNIDLKVDADIVSKVSPLPCGYLRLYGDLNEDCSDGLHVWRRAVVAATPLATRNLSILISFSPSPFIGGRHLVHSELLSTSLTRRAPRTTKQAHYDAVIKSSFVAAPAGRGQDTDRFYETVALGAVPIVRSGPLDQMYLHFPCVIVSSYANITAAKLAIWRDLIIARFGALPHRNKRVAALLSSWYYSERIRRGEPLFATAPEPDLGGIWEGAGGLGDPPINGGRS